MSENNQKNEPTKALTAMQSLEAKLFANVKPTSDDLENALIQALHERRQFQQAMDDMCQWLTMMVVAQMADDTPKVIAILCDYIANRVSFIGGDNLPEKTNGTVH